MMNKYGWLHIPWFNYSSADNNPKWVEAIKKKLQLKLNRFTLSIVLISQILDLAVFDILGAYLSLASLARLLAERTEIAYQRFPASAPHPGKFYQGWQSCYVLTEWRDKRVDTALEPLQRRGVQVLFHLADPQPECGFSVAKIQPGTSQT